jgi:hypothetical protein
MDNWDILRSAEQLIKLWHNYFFLTLRSTLIQHIERMDILRSAELLDIVLFQQSNKGGSFLTVRQLG